jgi:GH25 family lysozyme M1 (1,4-beta-N-acetylmuramidase)
MTISQFVDLSVFNPTDVDWQTYKQWSKQGDGIARVAIRSSYGTGFTDAAFETHRANALQAGIDPLLSLCLPAIQSARRGGQLATPGRRAHSALGCADLRL